MARITFSLTPLRFSSIILSGDRSKLGIRESIIEMMVFSLKPALASLTTEALVSGVFGLSWAKANGAKASITPRVTNWRTAFMIILPPTSVGLARRYHRVSDPTCRSACQSSLHILESLYREVHYAHTSSPRLHPHYSSPVPNLPAPRTYP